MGSIADRQAEPETWRYQVAAQRTYAKAKRYRFVAFLPELALAGLGAVVAILEVGATWIGAVAGGWIFVSRILLKPQEVKNRRLGAALQEHFDTEVLDIQWNEVLRDRVVREIVVRSAGHAAGQPEPWYPTTATDGVVAALACQRANTVWAARQHAAYSWVVGVATALLGVAGVILALALDASLVTYLTTIMLPSLPALLDGAEPAEAHSKSARERMALNKVIQNAFQTKRRRDTREIQNRVHSLRSESPMVPETFYKLIRKRYEADMTAAYEET